MSSMIPNFLGGAITLGFAVIALFFLKFWRRTRDPFFGAFALAFLMLGIGRVVEAALRNAEISTPGAYLFRLAGFLIIIYAILQKNMASRK